MKTIGKGGNISYWGKASPGKRKVELGVSHDGTVATGDGNYICSPAGGRVDRRDKWWQLYLNPDGAGWFVDVRVRTVTRYKS